MHGYVTDDSAYFLGQRIFQGGGCKIVAIFSQRRRNQLYQILSG